MRLTPSRSDSRTPSEATVAPIRTTIASDDSEPASTASARGAALAATAPASRTSSALTATAT